MSTKKNKKRTSDTILLIPLEKMYYVKMSFYLEHLSDAGVSKYEFALPTEGDTLLHAELLRTYLDTLLEHAPTETHTVALSGDVGTGKTTYASRLARLRHSFNRLTLPSEGPALADPKTDQNSTPDGMIKAAGSTSQTTLGQGKMVLSWIDASWAETETHDVVQENRAVFLEQHPGFNRGGINIIEHPECCSWNPALDVLLELEHDYEDEPLIAALYVDRARTQHPAFLSFLKQSAHLRTWHDTNAPSLPEAGL